MHTEEDEVPVASKKKIDKGQASSDVSGSPDKPESKKAGKSDGEDPKPRIVLTFRSDKKNSNMKIVPNDDKTEEFSPRRSGRTRNKWEWSEEAEVSRRIFAKKDKNSSQSVSETDETSDSSHTTPKRSTRRRSKDSSDNVLANAIARKEKSYNEPTPGPTQRLSRRIKPTAKILANEELRIGLESQNNARLGIQNDKPEEGVRTRKSAQSVQAETEPVQAGSSTKKETRSSKPVEEVAPPSAEVTPEKKQSPNTVMKLKHLCELGLKAINPEALEDEAEEMEEDDEHEEADEIEEEFDEDDENEEIDDDSEVINKLLEADEDTSDEDFNCAIEMSKAQRPRRSTRLCSSYGIQDNVSPVPVDEDQKGAPRRSRRATRIYEFENREYRPSRKRSRMARNEEAPPEIEEQDDSNNSSTREAHPRRVKSRGGWWASRGQAEDEPSEQPPEEDTGEPAGGEEGSEATCPDDESAIVATCFCEEPSNVHAAPTDLPDPVFCQAIEVVDGVRVGCSHAARRAGGALGPLLRAGPRAPFLLACALHAAQLRRHMCCPACGLFCTQGTFYQCSLGHLFHLECGLPYNDVKLKPGCPHCGLRSYRWQPANKDCVRVRLEMRSSNKRIFLPDQREQCTPAYLTFTTKEPTEEDESPLIPEDLLPSTPVDLKHIRAQEEPADVDEALSGELAQRLSDAIRAGDSLHQLLPLIVSRSVVNSPLASLEGGTALHAAAAAAHLAALHALSAAGAHLDAPDLALRTPLLCALHALLEKSEQKSPTKPRKMNEKDTKEDVEVKEELNEEKDEKINVKNLDEARVEDYVKVIRYLVAAGCDVNYQGAEGMTALHVAAQHGLTAACRALLDAPGAEVDARDHGGWTPLVWAAENNHLEAVRLLLSRGADAETRDAEGNGAVHWCALGGRAAPLRLLLAAAPRLADAPNEHRDTPLHVAARQGHYACVVVLLAQGARTDMENSEGEIPAEVCGGACRAAIALNMQMALLAGRPPARRKLLSSDISNGTEMYPIPCVNEVDDEPLPTDFTYVADHVMPEPLAIDNSIPSLQGCACTGDDCSSSSCACGVLSVRRWSRAGRLLPAFPHHDPPMLFECNATCACNKRKCSNMLITRLKSLGSVFVRAAVFRTARRGWGLRAAAAAARGAPVALYCGELLPLAAADTRANDQYLFALDVKPDLLEQCSDKRLLCVDACRWGGGARFINHSCAPNLAPVRVFCGARDLRLPVVALFATRAVRAGEELTFDYGDKFWSVKSKWLRCECGAPDCRYPEKTADDD